MKTHFVQIQTAKAVLPCLVASSMLFGPNAAGADAEAAKPLASTVCAACHGANGVSVADHIPNLAGQRAIYLANELEALKSGTRKSEIMNVIAARLTREQIGNLAAYFSSQPAASGAAKSAQLPHIAKTHIAFPADFKTGYTRYHALNLPETKQVKIYYANAVALAAARAGKPLPDGAAIVLEVHAAKLDADKKPLAGGDGIFVPDRLLAYTAMAREAGWGADIPEALRNENWNYAIFSADRQLRVGPNHAECLACHKAQEKSSYLFSAQELAQVR